ncbi:MAG: RNA repair transcriptional activator RtcR family protein, partial [Litorimonas sp.]
MAANVVIGFLGTKLDSGTKLDRWNRWRPTVNLCQQDDFVVDRLELLTEPHYGRIAEQVRDDIALISPETTVEIVDMPIADPWDLGEVYGALYDFADLYDWKPETERYLMHITTGTHVAQICQFLLTEARFIPGEILQLSPPRRNEPYSAPGAISIIDLDLSRYDPLANRFEARRAADETSLTDGLQTRSPRFARTLADVTRVAT